MGTSAYKLKKANKAKIKKLQTIARASSNQQQAAATQTTTNVYQTNNKGQINSKQNKLHRKQHNENNNKTKATPTASSD